MPSGLGPRVALLAAALVAAAVVGVVATWWAGTIIAVIAVAVLVVLGMEIVVRHREGSTRSGDASSGETFERREGPPPEPERPPLVGAPPPREPPRAEPEPPPIAVPPLVRESARREWNLWELEQASRKASGGDPLRDEERNYLLVYLRDFANAEGTLPADFDALVRDSFADVIPAR